MTYGLPRIYTVQAFRQLYLSKACGLLLLNCYKTPFNIVEAIALNRLNALSFSIPVVWLIAIIHHPTRGYARAHLQYFYTVTLRPFCLGAEYEYWFIFGDLLIGADIISNKHPALKTASNDKPIMPRNHPATNA